MGAGKGKARRGQLKLQRKHMFNAGLVPAHRHKNRDGSKGGWVAETAEVSPDATIGMYATVHGNAKVLDRAKVLDQAEVFQDATVSGDAIVRGHARVFNQALPYIPVGAIPNDPEVRDHDPEVALYGGSPDGLRIPLEIAARAAVLMRPGGFFVMEHADVQGDLLGAALAATGWWQDIADHEDLNGRPRAVTAVRARAAGAS